MESLQAVVFDKKIWTRQASDSWLAYNGKRTNKQPIITSIGFRYTIKDPSLYKRLIHKSLGNGIIYVIGMTY